ncbi:MAG: hypothetical protein A2992_06970 [Elusimicrobia bacterium RIFCSPLOWO2_01_FULL_59_12]|nr:MAG: hypothetical protein A2992_06970 [Elusimicrobia bacterium RIFCSPLOWO2_01_FULL_59_12]
MAVQEASEASDFTPDDFHNISFRDHRLQGHRDVLHKMETLISGGRILDIGCGAGDFLSLAQEAGWDVHGLDVSKPLVEFCQKRLTSAEIHQGTLHEARFPADYFDAVCLNSVLEHAYDPSGLLREISRILKERGVLFICVPNEESLVSKIGDLYFRLRGSSYTTRLSPLHSPFHVFGFSPRTLQRMVERNGLTVIETQVTPGQNDFPSDGTWTERLERRWRGAFVALGGWLGMGQALSMWVRKGTSYDTVCFGDQWDDWHNRRQKLMHTLASQGHVRKVLYIERPLTAFSFLKYLLGKTDAATASRWKRVFRRGWFYQEGSIYIWTPLKLLPFLPWSRLRRLQERLAWILERPTIRRLMKRHQFKDVILFITHPFGTSKWAGQFGERLLCYDVNEDFSAFPGLSPSIQEWLREEDRGLTSAADQIFASAACVYDEKRRQHPRVALLPNGVDLNAFAKTGPDGMAEELRSIPRPRVGYVGRLTPRMNFGLLRPILHNRPEWSFVFIGDVSPGVSEVEELRKLPNAYFLGPRPYEQLPRYLAGFDVCLSLYRDTALNKTGSCTKIYLYLAAGKPVVSTPCAEADTFHDVVSIVPEDPERLEKAIAEAMSESGSQRAQGRRHAVALHTWQSRADEIARCLRIAPRTSSFDIVMYLPQYSSWSNFHRRPMIEHLARALQLSGGRLLCVERPICPWTTPWKHEQKFQRWLKEPSLHALAENLFMLTPMVWAHDALAAFVPGGLALNRVLLSRQIKRALITSKFCSPLRISWIQHPYQKNCLGLAGEYRKVYECYDLYERNPQQTGFENRLNAWLGKAVVDEVDLIFVNSERLLWRYRERHPRVFPLYAAADTECFGSQNKAPIELEINALPRPWIGFAGSINEQMDLDLLCHAADRWPGASFMLIGPINGRRAFRTSLGLNRLLSKPNVRYLGEKPYEDLPSYLQRMNVLLMPFRVMEYTHHTFFNKVFQYLALGKPVVSTAMHESLRLKDLLYVAHDQDSFVKLIDTAMKEQDPAQVERRRAFARENNWNRRIEGCLQALAGKEAAGVR